MARLAIQLFGTFQVHVAEQPITKFRSNKSRALLAFLATKPEPQERSILAGLLWPEMNESNARRNLTQALRFLRRSLGNDEWILADNRYIGLNWSAEILVDPLQFQQLLDAQQLEEAIDLYRGEFLAGFALPDNNPFEEWIRTNRELWQRRALDALSALTEQRLASGDFNEAIDFARQQLALDRWRESTYRQLMRGFAGLGDRVGALNTFTECKLNLADEFGIQPSAETVALRNQLQAMMEIRERRELPRFSVPFVGRRPEMSQLTTLLQDPTTLLINVVAPGGTGKTRLVLETARRLSNDIFPDGIHFIPLATQNRPAELPAIIARAVGYYFHDDMPQSEQLLGYLRSKSLLLILDNFEQFTPDGIPFLQQLVQDAACKICLTSRQRVTLQAETIFQLFGLAADSDANQLFVQSARRTYSHFSPTERQLETIKAICQHLQGNALAIVLAATWIDSLSVDNILIEIEKDLDFLSTEHADLPARQRSIRAVFDHSWHALTKSEQDALTKLSLFRGGFTANAATAIANTSVQLLARLVGKSLVQYDHVAERYNLHELLRQYCSEKLAQSGHSEQLSQTYSEHFTKWITRLAPQLNGHNQIEVVGRIAIEQENLRAAWQWATEAGELDLLHEALDAYYLALDLSSQHISGIQLFTWTHSELENSAKAHPDLPYLQARLLNRHYLLTRYSSQKEVAGMEELLDYFREREDKLEAAIALGYVADKAFRKRDIAKAVKLYKDQLQLLLDENEMSRAAHCLVQLANSLFWGGKINEGQAALDQSLDITDANGDRIVASQAHIVYCGSHLYYTGNYALAMEHINYLDNLNQELQDAGLRTLWMLIALVYQGYAQLIAGDLEGAEEKCRLAQQHVAEAYAAYPQLVADSFEGLYKATIGENEAAYLQATTAMRRSNQAGGDLFGLQASALSACGLGDLQPAWNQVYFIWQLCHFHGLSDKAIVLSVLPVVAYLLDATDQSAAALSLITLGKSHRLAPLGWWRNMKLMQDLEARLNTTLTPDEAAAARKEGREMSMAEAIPTMLKKLGKLSG